MHIHVTNLIGSETRIASAWEPYAGHSTIMSLDGERMGRVGTEPVPAELDALPARSTERMDAVRAWQRERDERAYAAILAERPEFANGERRHGEISL